MIVARCTKCGSEKDSVLPTYVIVGCAHSWEKVAPKVEEIAPLSASHEVSIRETLSKPGFSLDKKETQGLLALLDDSRKEIAQLRIALSERGTELATLKLTLQQVDAGRICAESELSNAQSENKHLMAALTACKKERNLHEARVKELRTFKGT